MIRCELCGKECKTSQGLAGHRQWVHGIAHNTAQLRLEPPAQPAIQQQLSELEGRLELAELQAESLTEQVQASGEQVKALQEQLEDAQNFAEHVADHAGERIADLAKAIQLKLKAVTDTVDKNLFILQDRVDQLYQVFDKHVHKDTGELVLSDKALALVQYRVKKAEERLGKVHTAEEEMLEAIVRALSSDKENKGE